MSALFFFFLWKSKYGPPAVELMFVCHQNLNIYFSFCRQLFLTETMVAAILKMYFFGTALSVLAVLYEIADSVGGLMHVQDHHYLQELNQQTDRDISSNNWRGRPVTKNIGSWEDRHVVVFGHVLQLHLEGHGMFTYVDLWSKWFFLFGHFFVAHCLLSCLVAAIV